MSAVSLQTIIYNNLNVEENLNQLLQLEAPGRPLPVSLHRLRDSETTTNASSCQSEGQTPLTELYRVYRVIYCWYLFCIFNFTHFP